MSLQQGQAQNLATGGKRHPFFQPDAQEILVDTVQFLRFAEVEGRYAAAVAAVNPAA